MIKLSVIIKLIIIAILILIIGIIIGFIITPKEIVYDFPTLNFVKNVTHGDDFNMTPEDIILSYRIHCKSFRENGDEIDINMCEECWEGIDCYQKTWDTVYQNHPEIFLPLNISDNATDFCNQIVESSFYTITWEELRDYRLENNFDDAHTAYKTLFDEKCKQNLSVFDVIITNTKGEGE